MPCLNEAETVGSCVSKALRALREQNIRGEVIVADNGSTDGSQSIARRLGARVVHVPDKGYGSALMGGFAAARGVYVIMGDADDSYDFANLGPFIEKLREGNDLVMGNRFQGGIHAGAMPPANRYLGNPMLTRLGKLFFGSPVGDFYCGLRGLSKESFERLDLRTTGMEFASEMVVKATLKRMRIAEVPTTLSPALRTRPPHLRPWRDGWRGLRFLLLYSPRWLFLYPGLLMMAAGTLGLAWLLPHPQRIGNVTFDGQTLLFAAIAVVVGFQAVLFSMFTKVFAISEGLLPEDPRLNRILRYVTLEVGLVVGFVLFAIGAAGSVYAFVRWSQVSFGALQMSRSLRVIVPSVVSLVLGIETILSSFFLSILGLRRRAAPVDPSEASSRA
jgi:glycosyltransferase involved in cell wall biosynthesis